MNMEAQLSLPPLLHLSAIMARDLQQEYLPLLPRFINKVWGKCGKCHTLYVWSSVETGCAGMCGMGLTCSRSTCPCCRASSTRFGEVWEGVWRKLWRLWFCRRGLQGGSRKVSLLASSVRIQFLRIFAYNLHTLPTPFHTGDKLLEKGGASPPDTTAVCTLFEHVPTPSYFPHSFPHPPTHFHTGDGAA